MEEEFSILVDYGIGKSIGFSFEIMYLIRQIVECSLLYVWVLYLSEEVVSNFSIRRFEEEIFINKLIS